MKQLRGNRRKAITLEEKVRNNIQKEKLIQAKEKVIIGVSGGPDSICLLDMMRKLQEKEQFSILVCHINHQIRKEAYQDQEFVENYCKKYDIPCYCTQIDVTHMAKTKKIGLEEAGRQARYAFFEEIFKQEKADRIATAHTQNDRVETVLMHLLRGSGISGLKGIGYTRENGKYIRPLIEINRKEIEAYCEQNQLNPRIDCTNQDNTYTRNRIRNELIPYLEKEYNPNLIESITRLAKTVEVEDAYLQQIAKEKWEEMKIKQDAQEIVLDLKKFNQQDLVIKNRIVIYTITILFGSSSGLEKVHIRDIISLCENNVGNKYLIPNKKLKVLVKNQKIFFRMQAEASVS